MRIGSLAPRRLGILAVVLGMPGPGSAQPAVVGQWSAPSSWPIVPAHAALLADGRVLAFGNVIGQAPRIWDPASASFTTVTAIGTTITASAHAILPDGDIAVLGGRNAAGAGITDTHFYDVTSGIWGALPYMSQGRIEPTAILLGDGRMLALAGDRIEGQAADLHELAPVGSPWTALAGAELGLPRTPWSFALGDGTVLVAGPDRTTRRLDPTGLGSWSFVDEMTAGSRDAGTAVLVPGSPDRVLAIGGRDPAVSSCEVLDLVSSGVWEPTGSLARARRHHQATLLADGTVLVTGGTLSGDAAEYAVLPAERWVPQTGQWATMASMTVARRRGSIALLLPDARVLVAGGGDGTPGSEVHPDAEIFSPPYLFAGARPVITTAPGVIVFGGGFNVDTPQAAEIDAVWLVRAGSVTRSFNSDQRAVPLGFTVASATRIAVTAPTEPNEAPPGTWMLFLVNDAGIPSVAKVLRLEVNVPPPVLPHITSTPPPSTLVSAPFVYVPTATGTPPLSWSLTTAPSWLAVSPSTGAVAGVPPATGNVTVSLRATNAAGSETQTWTLSVVSSLTGVATLVPLGSTWRYFKGTTNPPANWATLGFDDSGWLSGPSGFGFGDNDDATVLSDMQNNYTTVFTRKAFNVYNVGTVTKVSILYEYDDGFAVYLNGTRIYSQRAPSTITNTSVATSTHEAGSSLLRQDITTPSTLALLQDGANVLAAVGLNGSLTSNDVTLKIVLELTGGTATPVDAPPAEPAAAWLAARPNPFRDGARIEFVLPRPGAVQLDVFDVAGQLRRRLELPAAGTGRQVVAWDGLDAEGARVPAGVYLYRLRAPGIDRTGKLTRAR